MIKKITLCGLTADELHRIISPEGYNLRHALVITNFLYKSKAGSILDLQSLPGSLRAFLDEEVTLGTYKPVDRVISNDNAVKYLFRNENDQVFETVFIPDKKRNTVCVSTQSGCRMGCSLCATGKYGFHGNLSAGDIVNQVISLPEASKITHVVFMGMGEPMDNLENVLKACTIMTSEWGLAKSPRNITISTVGITPSIREFLDRSACNLTLSLFSPFADERLRFVSAESAYPVRQIVDILGSYPLVKKRRLSVAYVMIKDLNDTDRHLAELIKWFKGLNIRVNLLPYHQTGSSEYISSPEHRIQEFRQELMMSGISASVRKSRGADISAACGLLASGLRKNAKSAFRNKL